MTRSIDRRDFARLLAAVGGLAGATALARAAPLLVSSAGEARIATILRRHFGAAAAPADVARRLFHSMSAGHDHTEDAAYFQQALANPAREADLERYVLQEFVIGSNVLT